jgi:hypothetical protein
MPADQSIAGYRLEQGIDLIHPSRGLRAAGGLWGPSAPALRGTVKRWFQREPAMGLDARHEQLQGSVSGLPDS